MSLKETPVINLLAVAFIASTVASGAATVLKAYSQYKAPKAKTEKDLAAEIQSAKMAVEMLEMLISAKEGEHKAQAASIIATFKSTLITLAKGEGDYDKRILDAREVAIQAHAVGKIFA